MAAGIQDGDCLCNRPSGVTFIRINDQRIGVSGLPQLFAGWSSTGRRPDDLDPTGVLAALREKNYVSRGVEQQYFEAVRVAYAGWLLTVKKGTADAQG